MGNSSLPNTNGGIVLSKIPLAWSSSQPAVLGAGTGCLQSCALSTSLPGSGTVTASCSPPTCNIGFPVIPASIASAIASDSCTQFADFFHEQNPNFVSCQQLIPVPVYASPILVTSTGDIPLSGNGAISGVITGAIGGAAMLATSTGCVHETPSTCTTSVYSFSTAKAATGPENPMPVPPNSLLFDLAGDKGFMGSDFGAQVISPNNFGSTSSAFTSLGTVTGKVLAASNNGSVAVFSDTTHSPNQAFIVNSNTSSLTATALNIPGAVAAAFSPDGLKTFIVGGTTANSLYVYSAFQALQGPSITNPQLFLSGSANGIAFSPNGAFAYVAESTGSTGNLTAFAACNNQIAATVPLNSNPIFMKVLPSEHINGRDSFGNLIPDGVHILILDSTGFDIITSTIAPPVAGNLCPQQLTFTSGDPLRPVQRIELGQGTLSPVNFFASADGSQLYIASTSNASILVYDFGTGAVTGIELLGNATPIAADMSADAGTIVIAGSDGLLHSVTTSLGGSDQFQLSFPNVPNGLNPFCTITPAPGPCTLNLIAVRP
jgi:hypothetical protein